MEMLIYTRRWGHPDRYKITRTATGWDVSFATHNGACDKTGAPVLYASLHHDSVNYPEGLGDYLAFLWDEATAGKIKQADEETALQELAMWVSACERASPGGLFTSYK